MSDRDYDPYARLDAVPSFTVTSSDIGPDGVLASAQYAAAAGGGDVSPALAWSGAPAGTASYAVTIYDPDAPTGSGFWHWAVANLPQTTTGLPSGAGSADGELPAGALVLPNELGDAAFTGAAPPQGTGTHRYFIVVHAVDVPKLEVPPTATPAVLGFNLHFHTLARAILVATAAFSG